MNTNAINLPPQTSSAPVPPETETTGTPSGKKTGAPSGADLGGATTKYAASPASTMPAPKIDAATMMLSLTALQGRITDQNLQTASTKIDGFKDDIKKLNEERLKQLEQHFNKLSEATRPKKCGLFGLIIRFFKTCIESIKHPDKAKELWTDFGQLAKDSIVNIIKDVLAIAAAVAGAVLTATGVGTALGAILIASAVCLVVSMALSDPEVIDTIVSALPQDKQESARKIMGYVAMAFTIASVVLSIASGIGMVKAAPGLINTMTKFVNTALQVASSVTSGATTIADGVDQKAVADSRADAQKAAAKGETIGADMLKVEENMSVELNTIKTLMESHQKTIESTFRMIMNTASAQRGMASV